MPTWAVLSEAHHTPGLSQVQLAAQIGIEGPTLARHLDRLSPRDSSSGAATTSRPPHRPGRADARGRASGGTS